MSTMMDVLEMEPITNKSMEMSANEKEMIEEIEVGVIPAVSSDRCYTVEDIQIILGISRPSVYNLIRQKQFKALKIGKGYRIPRKSFDDWLEN